MRLGELGDEVCVLGNLEPPSALLSTCPGIGWRWANLSRGLAQWLPEGRHLGTLWGCWDLGEREGDLLADLQRVWLEAMHAGVEQFVYLQDSRPGWADGLAALEWLKQRPQWGPAGIGGRVAETIGAYRGISAPISYEGTRVSHLVRALISGAPFIGQGGEWPGSPDGSRPLNVVHAVDAADYLLYLAGRKWREGKEIPGFEGIHEIGSGLEATEQQVIDLFRQLVGEIKTEPGARPAGAGTWSKPPESRLPHWRPPRGIAQAIVEEAWIQLHAAGLKPAKPLFTLRIPEEPAREPTKRKEKHPAQRPQ